MKANRPSYYLILIFLFMGMGMTSCTYETSSRSTTTQHPTTISSSTTNPSTSLLPPTTSTTTTTSQPTTTIMTLADYEGIYSLTKKTIESIDVTHHYLFNLLLLESGGTAKFRSVDFTGMNETLGTYTLSANGIVVLMGIKTYSFLYEPNTNTLQYAGRVDRRDVIMQFTRNDDYIGLSTSGGVSFYLELFGDPIEENFYNYAPTIILEGNDTLHIWYCSNLIGGNVTDYVAYRRGTLLGDGTWNFSEKEIVLAPTQGTWDERHICDPSVIRGEFTYHEETYTYLMAYLGCITNDSSRNEVGIAVSKEPNGPWIKIDEINPIANYYTSLEYTNDQWTWGFGQPSLVSVNKKGQVLLFYTKGIIYGTFTYVEHWDLSNLNQPIKLNEAPVTNSGVVNASGIIDVINNADFAYDPFYNRLYVVKEDFPYPNSGGVNWLTAANTVLYLNLNTNDTFVGESLFNGANLRWQVIGSIGPNQTNFPRNHNMGIMSDEYGWLNHPFMIPIVYTMSHLRDDYPNWNLKGQWPALHTYRLHGYVMNP